MVGDVYKLHQSAMVGVVTKCVNLNNKIKNKNKKNLTKPYMVNTSPHNRTDKFETGVVYKVHNSLTTSAQSMNPKCMLNLTHCTPH